MTANTKSLTPTADKVGTDVVALFKGLNTKATTYTDARNALIAREVILADNKRGTGTRLASAFGIDKGDVSRIATLAMALPAKGKVRASLKSFVIGTVDPNVPATVEPLAALGVAFRRTDKVKGAGTGTKGAGKGEETKPEVGTVTVVTSEGKVESPDLLAAVYDALMSGLIGLPELNAVIENYTAEVAKQDAAAA